jgi:hypothetical protein
MDVPQNGLRAALHRWNKLGRRGVQTGIQDRVGEWCVAAKPVPETKRVILGEPALSDFGPLRCSAFSDLQFTVDRVCQGIDANRLDLSQPKQRLV